MKNNTTKTKEELLQEIEFLREKLEKTENLRQNLNAANQQLQAAEQQLRAANQQLKAAEEQALRAKENFKRSSLLRNAILESPQKIIVFALDKNYRYLDFTTSHKQTMKQIWGVDIRIGDNMLGFIKNAKDRAKAKANFDRALKGEYFVLQEEYGDEHLRRTFYEDHYSPVYDYEKNEIIGLSVYVVEITQIKEAERKLYEQFSKYSALNKKYKSQNETLNALNQQLRAADLQLRAVNRQLAKREEILVEAQKIAHLGHWELDLTNEKLYWSDETYRIFGLKPQETETSYQAFLEFVHPDDRKKVDTAYKHALKNKTDYEVEHRIQLKTGEIKYVIEKCHTHYADSGEPTHSIGTILDITRQKQAETALRESMEQYRNIFNSTTDAMLIFDMEGKIVEANPQACKLYGHTYNEIRRMHGKELIHKDYQFLFEEFTGQLEKKGEFQSESVEVRIGDKLLHADIRAKLFKIKGVPHILALVRDITARKKAEAGLIRLSTAVQQSPVIIIITGPDGKLQYANPRFEEVTGYNAREVSGKHVEFLGKGTQPVEMVRDMWETISAGKVWHGEFLNKKKNGEPYWESASISPVFGPGGNITNFVKVAEDVTDRKRKEQIQKILHNISNAVITSIDLHDFARIVQKELGAVIDTTNFYIALYNKETNHFSFVFQQDEKDHFESLPADKTLTGYVFKTRKPLLATPPVMEELENSGEIGLYGAPSKSWLGIPLLMDKKAIGVFAVQSYTDENTFKAADIEILEIISHQISISINRKQKEEELKTALERAQESDRLKSAFLANMSHEIRTPMNGILGFINLLNDPGLSLTERERYTAVVNKSGERLLDTINDLIDISKIEAGQVEIIKKEVSVNHLMEELLAFFSLEAKSKGLSLQLEAPLPGPAARVVTDEAKLHGILTNLLKNALKFTEKGSITFGYRMKGNFMEFFVEDTGIGIPQSRQQAVFNRFEQADINFSTRPFEGSGLGLTIAKAYVEMLGGEIRVVSEEGQGTVFSFTIPYETKKRQTENPAGKKITSPVTRPENKGPAILIVEDDETSAMFLKAILKDKFGKIYLAPAGREAITLCRRNPEISIILMDIKLPGMNGLEATREIRKFNKEVVIIAQTAYALSGDEEKTRKAGCNDYITKPISRKALYAMLDKWMKKKG